ncbi:MAG TPA: hypothetical protein VJY62_12975 [Bacteroidia bacterium]|nr:hypothetical protein [Bacteroidia bacterium]
MNPAKKIFLLLFITPVLTLLLNIAIVTERNPFYSSWSDPTYDYMFNGLNLASGHFKAGHADHPGTPLQIYSGITLKFFHLFRSEKDIVKDVILDPEWYLFRMCITSCILISLPIFFAGWLMMRLTGNIFYALLIQATHLVSLRALFFSQNLMTEFILVTTGILLAPLIVAYVLSENKKRERNLILAAAIISGIMIAGKISSFPVILMWLIMSKNLKQGLTFLLTTVLSFVLITFPGWHCAPQFFGWIGNMATHTGQYGRGGEGFANWNEFFKNIGAAANDVWLFTITFFIITIILIKQIINFFRPSGGKLAGEKKHPASKTIKPFLGIWVAIVLQTFIVCKHYSPHYLIPAHLLVIPAWLIMAQGFFRSSKEKIANNQNLFFKIIPVAFSIFLLIKAEQAYYFWPGLKQPDKIMLEKVKPYKYDLILLDCTITAPFPQPALFFGVNFAGERAAWYFHELEKYYTGFYFVNRESGKLKGWQKEYDPKEVLKDSMNILYYSSNDTFNIDSLQWKEGTIRVDSVFFSYRFPPTRESVFVARIKMPEVRDQKSCP